MPASDLTPAVDAAPAEPAARLAIRRLPLRRALDWLVAGWADFRRTPAPFAVATVVLLILAVLAARAANWLPLLLLPPYLGMVAAYARMADRGQVFLAGSGAWRSAPLWGVSLAILLLGTVLNGLLAASAVAVVQALIRVPMPAVAFILALMFLLKVLAVLVLAGCWLAPALVVNRKLGTLQALRLSMMGSLRNAGAFLAIALVSAGLLWLAALPLGLGLVVALPVLACAAVRAADDIVGDAA